MESRRPSLSTVRELLRFVAGRRKLWLAPIVALLLLLGLVLVLVEGTAVAPFIYTLF